jgi:hypothetical protein
MYFCGRKNKNAQIKYNNIRSDVYTALTTKNTFFWYVTPCGSCKANVSEERILSIITVERISELGTTLVDSYC